LEDVDNVEDVEQSSTADIEVEAKDEATELFFEKEKWKELGLSSGTIDLLESKGYYKPTPVQEMSLPISTKGRDLLVSARTGSGKTAGFCFPMIEKIRGRKSGTLGLILCPTREIALQTRQVLEEFAMPQGISVMAVIGGVNMREETRCLQEYPQIIVGTPGRISDHQSRGNIWLEYIEVLVLDEADRMLQMGFAKQLNEIIDATTPERQTLLFSATIDAETEKLAQKYLKDPERISIGGSALSVADSIEQEILWVNRDSKVRELRRILREETGSVIVFTRTKSGTLDLWRALYDGGIKDVGFLSSDKAQKDREKTLTRFRDGELRILVATEVAGRGIDVDDVSHVVNYDVPLEPGEYVHRAGRTGRKDKTGKATTFVTPQDSRLLIQIEKTLGIRIPEKRAEDYVFKGISSGRRGGGRGGRRGGGRGGSRSGSRGGGRGRSGGSSGGRSR